MRRPAGTTCGADGRGSGSGLPSGEDADAKKSRALYAVSSNVEGAQIATSGAAQANQAIVGLLKNAPEALTTDLQLMATVLQSTIAGVKRQLLESDMPEAQFEVMQRELVLMV